MIITIKITKTTITPIQPKAAKNAAAAFVTAAAIALPIAATAFAVFIATAYPDCRLVVTKETMTVEGMIKIVYDLLKDKLNIAKLTFTSGVNAASQEYETSRTVVRCAASP